jgi:TRAP-type transport system small permease protein
LESLLTWMAAIPLMVILVLTFADVFARYAFSAPIKGGVEVIEFAMAILIFCALPLVTRSQGHVTVSLVDNLFTRAIGRIRIAFCDAISAFALGLMTWRLWVQATGDLQSDRVTTVLGWYYAPLYFFLAVFAGLSCAVMLHMVYLKLTRKEEA